MAVEPEQRQSAARTKRLRAPRKSVARRIVGWSLIVLAVLGLVLPVIPGLPFLAIGIVALGPHDPTLRRMGVTIRLLLRRWSTMRNSHLRRLGCLARGQYAAARQIVRLHLHSHQHGRAGWRAHLPMLITMLIGLTASAAIMWLLWHTIL